MPSLAETRAFQGCELVETYLDQANPDVVVLWEKWQSRGDQEGYLAWRLETGMLDAIGPFMAAAPRIVHLDAAD